MQKKTYKTLQKNFLEFTLKCIIVGVEGGVSEIFLGMQSYSFGNSGPHAKIGPSEVHARVAFQTNCEANVVATKFIAIFSLSPSSFFLSPPYYFLKT